MRANLVVVDRALAISQWIGDPLAESVDYERKIDHPNAERDAVKLAQLCAALARLDV